MSRSACVLLLLSLPASAAGAQYFSVARWDPVGSRLHCEQIGTSFCASDAECPDDSGCLDFEPDDLCGAPRALFCAGDASAEETACPANSPNLYRIPDAEPAIFVCMPDLFETCEETIGTSGACFYSPDGFFPVDWAAGDCDMDGVPNGEELALEAVCFGPRLFGVVTPDGACELVQPCLDDADCVGGTVCRRPTPGASHRFCVDDAEHALCCDGALECPGGGCPVATGSADAAALCADFDYCAEWSFSERAACVHYAGEGVADPAAGDCDGDGIPNAEDGAPCEPGEPPPQDAGASPDAGPPAAPDRTPRFAGGGGAVCAASPGRVPAGGAALFGLLAVALLVKRRRA
ncbi:MAG TPA: hypothetical protein DEF51_38505 [Myxococcales bacterium]|nr:hypothetical protein [Myxococcales bacterium]